MAATASLFEAKKLKLVQNIEPGLPAITGDRDRLIQVVINLISNAVKFTDAGSVTCSACLRDGELVVSVTDSGIGIARPISPRSSRSSSRWATPSPTNPKAPASGLPICKEIVEFHGGRIWVESESGKGSTFSFTFVAEGRRRHCSASIDIESLVRQLRENVATHHPRRESILVVDDDPNIRSLLQQEFIEAGYTVRLAENGRQALTLIREEAPGLVILDVMMPEMNGFDVAAVLKNDPATMDIPIIILSIVEDKERGFRLGVDRYLTKPIDTVPCSAKWARCSTKVSPRRKSWWSTKTPPPSASWPMSSRLAAIRWWNPTAPSWLPKPSLQTRHHHPELSAFQ